MMRKTQYGSNARIAFGINHKTVLGKHIKSCCFYIHTVKVTVVIKNIFFLSGFSVFINKICSRYGFHTFADKIPAVHYIELRNLRVVNEIIVIKVMIQLLCASVNKHHCAEFFIDIKTSIRICFKPA